MQRLIVTSALAAVAFAIPTFLTAQAHAGLEACGDIHVEASAKCEAYVGAECTAKCTPVSFQAACAAEGYAQCKGECNLPSVNCDASCEGECKGQCTSNPNFNCTIDCEGRCDGDCTGHCSSAADKAECQAQCKANCKGSCEASCNGAPVECEGSCHASCEGTCTANTNFECQAQCQAELSVDCEAELQGGCEAKCSRPEGAIFCDGQFVDDNGNAQECLDSIKAWLAANASFHAGASGSAQCSGGSCTAEGEAEAGCGLGMVSPSAPTGTAYYLAGLAALAGIAVGKLRRRR